MSSNILQKYIQEMEKLRIDRAHGAAPNKPLLVLAVKVASLLRVHYFCFSFPHVVVNKCD